MKETLLVPISALEHWSYCPRQCALIHIEQVWDDNVFTIRGIRSHERTDTPESRAERGVRVERALPVWSDLLGLVGKCDVVEFDDNLGTVEPVEYKSGKRPSNPHAEVQLCAQAMCLEEMLSVSIPTGAIFVTGSKKRITVTLNEKLRAMTRETAEAIRGMLAAGQLPIPVNDKRCPTCSLIDACLPKVVSDAVKRSPEPFQPLGERELP